MERTAIPGLARRDARGSAAGRLRQLWRRLVPLAAASTLVSRWTELATWSATLVGAIAFVRFALLRHQQLQSYDLAFFDQVVWNTSHGRFFQTSFVSYNFLGQHFQPVLLLFAGLYRLGAGVEALLVTQAIVVGAAALPLYYAVRRMTGNGGAALATALSFLLSVSLHKALDVDFHPEMLGFFFIFLALYFLAAARPQATILSLLPLLALKEDMFLVLAAFAALLFLHGHRRHARRLMALSVLWAVAIVFIAMPLIRGPDAGLVSRYGYLVSGSNAFSLVPHIVIRGAKQIRSGINPAIEHLLPSLGVGLLLDPLAVLLVIPALAFHSLADYTPQAHLDLHYVAVPLALSFVAASLGLRKLSNGTNISAALPRPWSPASLSAAVAAAMLAVTLVAFALSSPFAPGATRVIPDAEHMRVVSEALAVVPPEAPVSAQSTIVARLAHRRTVYEFPQLDDSQYVVIDTSLPVTRDERAAGYDRNRGVLPGFEAIFDHDGVRVLWRTP